MIVTTRIARAQDLAQIAPFYRDGYKLTLNPSDVIVVAEHEDVLCGVVRICVEHDVLVLRGMRVRESMRRHGIGTRLLQAVEPVIGESECFCIPYRHLGPFYGRIGFVEIEEVESPPFLRERCAEYRREYGLDIVIMRRPNGTKAHQATA